jgi:hypothetical protein
VRVQTDDKRLYSSAEEREREEQQRFEQLRHQEPMASWNERATRFDISLERSETWRFPAEIERFLQVERRLDVMYIVM